MTIIYPSAAQIDEAAALLDAGELVAFPTETVYGLGGDAENPEAIARIYAAKGRPANHPVIVHLAPEADPGYWVREVPADAQKLIDAFWPGPLTLILKRAAHIPAAVSGGQDSVGVRCPSHPVAQQLLSAFHRRRTGTGKQGGVAGPSANRFGHVSPTTAQHVRDEFGDAVHVLDGGAADVGIESTILDLSRGFPALLRPGHVSPRQIADVIGIAPKLPDGSDATAPRASGTLKAHYAPRTPLLLLPFASIEPLLRNRDGKIALVARASSAGEWVRAADVHFVAAPEDPQTYARDLYGLLRALDRANVERILIEKLPETVEWIAVNDRLGRAAAAFEAEE
ncbi:MULTISPECIES: L-threonylcarbamoyladenylate synthase [Caballeronia]|uniref:L-threonylcarbamoyladenylate synthase n=1 Tax=Caballeronia TaxID=1827195 RepID=UPI00158D552C|nr:MULTISPECIES: L-threonylcarbamoyladenylate synthase [Caballeronia]MCG7399215.1 threonylcarbamoyl-AMP synthase [Caballeronia zhejiangensis]MCI1042278.1 threonylcarbamoyl-AMP synthase [Caballeronia zhejiangensis]